MKQSTINRILETPLTFPYFDVDALRALEPMDTRLKASLYDVTPKIEKEYGFDPERVPEIILAEYQAGRYITRKMKDKGISAVFAAELSGMDKSRMSKYLSGKRPFSPGAANIAPFCYNVVGESCNKVMFGYEESITLPSVYAETAKALLKITPEKKSALLRKAQVQMALYVKQNPNPVKNAPHRDLSEMIGERIFELIYDQGTHGYLLFGQETPYVIRNYLRQFCLEEFKSESPRLGYLMYLAFESRMALDYFVAEDFTKFSDCYYNDGDEKVQITDKDTLQYIGICSSVPSEQKIKLMGAAIGAGLSIEAQNN